MSDILLITLGSHGDVHPFVGIGRELKARGHRVRLATNPYFESLIARAGLELVPLGEASFFTSYRALPKPFREPVALRRAVMRARFCAMPVLKGGSM